MLYEFEMFLSTLSEDIQDEVSGLNVPDTIAILEEDYGIEIPDDVMEALEADKQRIRSDEYLMDKIDFIEQNDFTDEVVIFDD